MRDWHCNRQSCFGHRVGMRDWRRYRRLHVEVQALNSSFMVENNGVQAPERSSHRSPVQISRSPWKPGRFNVLRQGMIALFFSATQMVCHAEQNLPCWMQLVENSANELHIVFLPGYYPIKTDAKRPQMRLPEGTLVNAPYRLVLAEGEAANISDRLHSGCKMTAERQEGKLGLHTEAWINVPGFPYSRTTRFILGETGPASQQPK